MADHLNGKHALVTGGGTGIGLAIAQGLAKAGATVTITGRRPGVLETAAAKTPGLHALPMDVSDETSVQDGVRAAVDARGPVSICVANAGIAEGQPLHKLPLADWRRMMAINLDGAFLTIRACLADMHSSDWGRVIAISSIAGIKGLKGAPAYTTSKHAMVGLIRGLAADYAGSGLTFNALCPAYVDTPIVDENTRKIAARAGIDHAAARAIMVGTNPHKRLITPQEIANAALWLCLPGSESVNGQAIEISGGQI